MQPFAFLNAAYSVAVVDTASEAKFLIKFCTQTPGG